jgi:hypothetical protein
MKLSGVHVIEIMPKEYNFPCIELQHILSSYIGNASRQEEIQNVINSFKGKIIDKLFLSGKELEEFQITAEGFPEISVKCKNLFTAIIMFGRYVPLVMLPEGCERWKLENGDTLQYNKENDTWILYKSNLVLDMFSPLEKVAIDEKRPVVTRDELEARSIYAYQEKKKKTQKEFEETHPGVPYGSVLIELGKTYEGHLDGQIVIKTINGQLWALPIFCGEFWECPDDVELWKREL